ncbi:MAG: flagellar biosynthetic protein FliR [Planctomycetota bacterium]|jgi:flagellar biosynthetic protein FliR
MDWLAQIDTEKFILFTLVLTRVSGLVITAPIYGSPEVPARVRALLAFSLAVLITPSQWTAEVQDPGTTLNYLVLIGSELLIGLCLGLGIVILFSGIQLAGQMIGRIGGLMLADVFDPSAGISVPMFSRLLYLVTLAVFVCIGGHRVVMAGLLDTFQTIPPGSGAVPTSIADTFVLVLAQSFVLAIRAAAPVVTSLLVSTLVMGLISRTLPQLNVLAVGFGMNAMLGFAVLGLSLGAVAWVFPEQLEATLETLLDAIHASAPSDWLH